MKYPPLSIRLSSPFKNSTLGVYQCSCPGRTCYAEMPFPHASKTFHHLTLFTEESEPLSSSFSTYLEYTLRERLLAKNRTRKQESQLRRKLERWVGEGQHHHVFDAFSKVFRFHHDFDIIKIRFSPPHNMPPWVGAGGAIIFRTISSFFFEISNKLYFFQTEDVFLKNGPVLLL